MSESNFGSASGTHSAYVVEVRGVLSEPFQHSSGFTITGEWRKFPAHVARCDIHPKSWHTGLIGDIPVYNLCCRQADELNLMDFNAAYTLACLLQTQAAMGQGIRCRLVEVEVIFSWSAKGVGVSPEISLFDLRREVKCVPLPPPPDTTT